MLSLLVTINILSISNAITQEWKVDLDSTPKPFYYYWQKCVGSGHASLALREDWQQLLTIAHKELGFEYVRFHGILMDDVGAVNGINDYSFVNIDKIYDYILSINMKPYVEISFMPDDFASGGGTFAHYKGNTSPPKNYTIWYEFIQDWTTHLMNRYGIDEISTWKFEVWNEPGNFDQYMALYNSTALAIKSVSKQIQGTPIFYMCII